MPIVGLESKIIKWLVVLDSAIAWCWKVPFVDVGWCWIVPLLGAGKCHLLMSVGAG